MADAFPLVFLLLFPIGFAMLWVLVTTLLGFASGWFRLQDRFLDSGTEPALLKLGFRSGALGWVNLNNALTLSACRSGLRIGMWKALGPFQRPFLVPWAQPRAGPVRRLVVSRVQLSLGTPAVGRLEIGTRDWEQLQAAVRER